MNNTVLKAGKPRQEQVELSAGFLKRTASTHLSQTYIAELRHTETNEVCTVPIQLQEANIAFYEWLYIPQSICPSAMRQLLNAVPPDLRILQA